MATCFFSCLKFGGYCFLREAAGYRIREEGSRFGAGTNDP